MMKKTKILNCIVLIFIATCTQGQDTLGLDMSYRLARENFPLIRQQRIVQNIREYTLENLSKGYLPQLSINGQASYQSEVTELPLEIPNISANSLSKDQYKLYLGAYQPVIDGHSIRRLQAQANANAEVELEKVEVELYKLKERIDQIYFGILLIDAQKAQTALLQAELQNTLNKTNAAIKNGTVLPSNAVLIKAEMLKISQRNIESNANRIALINIMSLLTGKQLGEATKFNKPNEVNDLKSSVRPETRLYEAQRNAISAQDQLIFAKNSVKIGLFAQAGYGRPAFNFLNNKFDFYYIGGVKLALNLSNFYTTKNDHSILALTSKSVDVQQENFEFNNNIILMQQSSEINKYKELILTDSEIIALRTKVISVADSQLTNGTITITDYLTYLNALDLAKQTQTLHELQLLQVQINQQTIKGN